LRNVFNNLTLQLKAADYNVGLSPVAPDDQKARVEWEVILSAVSATSFFSFFCISDMRYRAHLPHITGFAPVGA
jgi:hypothetical protein